jgi:hypothetical protein
MKLNDVLICHGTSLKLEPPNYCVLPRVGGCRSIRFMVGNCVRQPARAGGLGFGDTRLNIRQKLIFWQLDISMKSRR